VTCAGKAFYRSRRHYARLPDRRRELYTFDLVPTSRHRDGWEGKRNEEKKEKKNNK